jgi:phosphohistidine phosphatase
MKTVILMRHGKSSWKDRALDDHERPLKKGGRTAAPVMARWLAAHELEPDIVLCSSSRRTQETLERMREVSPGLPEAGIRPGLYEAAPATLLDELKRLPEDRASVLLVGHEPGLGELLRLLVRAVRNPEDRRAFEKFPTAAVAVLEADIVSWEELGPGSAELAAFAVPREVGAGPGAPS